LLPQRLGHGEAEALAQALLNDDRRGTLQCVYFERRPGRQLNDSNVRIVSCFAPDLLQDSRAFRIVGGTAARKDQLAIEITLHDSVGANHSERILEAVEAGNLRKNGAL